MNKITKVMFVGHGILHAYVQQILKLKLRNRFSNATPNCSNLLNAILNIKILIPNPIKYN